MSQCSPGQMDVISKPAPLFMTGSQEPSMSMIPLPKGRGVLRSTLLACSKDEAEYVPVLAPAGHIVGIQVNSNLTTTKSFSNSTLGRVTLQKLLTHEV